MLINKRAELISPFLIPTSSHNLLDPAVMAKTKNISKFVIGNSIHYGLFILDDHLLLRWCQRNGHLSQHFWDHMATEKAYAIGRTKVAKQTVNQGANTYPRIYVDGIHAIECGFAIGEAVDIHFNIPLQQIVLRRANPWT
jgi:hypothetical protein